jgi:transcriptional regulator with XRE-family HTH domain
MGIGERIKAARKREGMSQAELAKLVGRSQSAVAEWEAGETEPRRNIVETIARALNVSAFWLEIGGVDDQARSYGVAADADSESTGRQKPGADMAPIFASAASDGGEHRLKFDEIVERRPKPARWRNVKGLFGFYIATDAMAPRMNIGELVWVHPHRKPAPGQETLFLSRTDEDAGAHALIRVCAGQTPAKWIVKQYNPKKETDLKKSEWESQLIVDIELMR